MAPDWWRFDRVVEKSVHLPEEARFRKDRGALRRRQGRAVEAAAVRDPEARRDPAALRSPAGIRRRLQVLGGDARPLARSARQAAGGRGRGSSARLRRFRRHHSQGPVWRRHGAALGSRLLGIRRSRTRLQEGRSEIHPARRQAARQLGAGADERRPQRRQAHQLAPDQASRRIRQGGQGQRHPRRGSIGRLGTVDGADRRGQGQGAKAVHAGEGRQGQGRRGLAFEPRRGRGGARKGQDLDRAACDAAKPRTSAKPKKVAAMPDFVAPQLCASVERPPNADGWCHEIKFDGYRVQLRVEDGEAVAEDPQGAGLDRQIRRHRQGGTIAARCADRRRDRRARSTTACRISRRCRPRFPTARPTI